MKIATASRYLLNINVKEYAPEGHLSVARALWSLFTDTLIRLSSVPNGGIDFDSESIHQKLRSERLGNKSK